VQVTRKAALEGMCEALVLNYRAADCSCSPVMAGTNKNSIQLESFMAEFLEEGICYGDYCKVPMSLNLSPDFLKINRPGQIKRNRLIF
jgi:hypothetical protein